MIKLVPVLGSAIAATWAVAYTWALGEAACVYFGELAGGKTPDPERIQAAMRDAFKSARQQFSRTGKASLEGEGEQTTKYDKKDSHDG